MGIQHDGLQNFAKKNMESSFGKAPESDQISTNSDENPNR